MDNRHIWIVDDDESIRWVLERGLSEKGMDVKTFDSASKVFKSSPSMTSSLSIF